MSLVEQTAALLSRQDDAFQSYVFVAQEGRCLLTQDTVRRWEFFGDRFMAITLKNSKIMHLTFEDDKDRRDQIESAIEWWSK